MLVAIADVDAIEQGSPIDDHARHNTTSVYTAGHIFPMLPEKLSADLTSLVQGEERLAVVMEMDVTADGAITALTSTGRCHQRPSWPTTAWPLARWTRPTGTGNESCWPRRSGTAAGSVAQAMSAASCARSADAGDHPAAPVFEGDRWPTWNRNATIGRTN